MFSISFRKRCSKTKLGYFDHKNVNSLCSRHHYIISMELLKRGFKPISVHIIGWMFSKCITGCSMRYMCWLIHYLKGVLLLAHFIPGSTQQPQSHLLPNV